MPRGGARVKGDRRKTEERKSKQIQRGTKLHCSVCGKEIIYHGGRHPKYCSNHCMYIAIGGKEYQYQHRVVRKQMKEIFDED